MDKSEGFWRYGWRADRWALQETMRALKGTVSLWAAASFVVGFVVTLYRAGWSFAMTELLTASAVGVLTGDCLPTLFRWS